MTDLTFTILGCGNSYGVPKPGNDWGKCDPNEPKNRRMRCSLLVRSDTTTLVIDTGQDFRNQMNAHDIAHIDGLLYTHQHADHIAGADDVRVYADRQKKPLPAYMRASCQNEFEQRYSYLLHQKGVIYPPVLDTRPINFFTDYTVGDITFSGFPMEHGEIESCGFRIGNTAYALDMRYLTNIKSFEALQGIETLIIDAAGYHYPTNPVHSTLEDVYSYQAKIGAKRVILSVLSVAMDYKTLQNEIPDGFEAAYDGLSFKGIC